MERLIFGKLTATDIGIIIVATLYLVERVFSMAERLYSKVYKPIPKPTASTAMKCPDEMKQAIVEMQKAIVSINESIKLFTKLLSSTDEDGAPRIIVKASLYRQVNFMDEKLSAVKSSVDKIESALAD